MIHGPPSAHRLYRAYHLTHVGHIQRAEILEARDDGDALFKVKERADDHPVELWDRARFIGRIEAAVGPVTAHPSAAVAFDRLSEGANAGTNACKVATKLFKPLFANLPENDAGHP